MTEVTYYINTGTPGHPPSGVSVKTLKEALDDFRAYLKECDRFGTSTEGANMQVTSDRWPERTYEVGPRGGIFRNREWER